MKRINGMQTVVCHLDDVAFPKGNSTNCFFFLQQSATSIPPITSCFCFFVFAFIVVAD